MKRLLVSTALSLACCLSPALTAGALVPNKASDLRTVVGEAPGTQCPGINNPGFRTVDRQQNPDGTTSPFSIPAKSVFVVTSLDVQVGGNGAGATAEAVLLVSDGTGNLTEIAECGGIAGSNGFATASCTMPVGTAVKSGATLCFVGLRAIVHGFIARDK